MITLTRKDIAKRLKERPEFSSFKRKEIEAFIAAFLEEVKKAVVQEGYGVIFRGFGTFKPKRVRREHRPTAQGVEKHTSEWQILSFSHSRLSRVKVDGKSASV